MSIEYIINLDCPVKQSYSTEELIELVKKRSQAEIILNINRQEGGTPSAKDIIVSRSTYRSENKAELKEQVSLQTLINESEELYTLAHYCIDCPANASQKPFGCYSSISYPIFKSTEKWLLSLLPSNTKSTAGFVLKHALEDLKQSESIEEMRQNPTFFESDQAVSRSWSYHQKTLRKRTVSVNSSQIFQMMFCVGSLNPHYASMLILIFGIVPHNCDPNVLDDMDKFMELADGSILLQQEITPQIADVSDFLLTLGTAVCLDVEILVDF